MCSLKFRQLGHNRKTNMASGKVRSGGNMFGTPKPEVSKETQDLLNRESMFSLFALVINGFCLFVSPAVSSLAFNTSQT